MQSAEKIVVVDHYMLNCVILSKLAYELVCTFKVESTAGHIEVLQLRPVHERFSNHSDPFIAQSIVAQIQSYHLRVSDSLAEQLLDAIYQRDVIVAEVETLNCQLAYFAKFYRLSKSTSRFHQ